MADKSLSELIREFRKQTLTKEGKLFSLMDLSLEIGWANPSTLSRIENGEVVPSKSTILKISRALRLEFEEEKMLMRAAGYKEYNREITDEYIAGFVESIRGGFDSLAFPVTLVAADSRMVYWNRFTEVFFIDPHVTHEEAVAGFENVTHIDSLFNPIYGIHDNILNWDKLAEILVRNVYVLTIFGTEEASPDADIEKWMEYPDFKKYWEQCVKMNTKELSLYNIPFIYRHKEIGITNLTINSSMTYEDKRFMIEQFTPNTKEDTEKMVKYWNKVRKNK